MSARKEDLTHLALWNDGRVMSAVGFPPGLGYDAAQMAAWLGRCSRCVASEDSP